MNPATMERVIKIYARTVANLEKEVRLLQKEHRAQNQQLERLQARLRKIAH